jgi:predicted nucleic acid-binding protein
MESALALAAENRISAYDAQYIALARQLQTVCVTEDRRVLGQFPALTRSMQAFGQPE